MVQNGTKTEFSASPSSGTIKVAFIIHCLQPISPEKQLAKWAHVCTDVRVHVRR